MAHLFMRCCLKHFFFCGLNRLPNCIPICAFFFRNKADWLTFDTILPQPPALSLCKMAAETLPEKSHQYSGFVSRNLLHNCPLYISTALW